MKAKNKKSCSVVFKMLNNFPPLETNEKKNNQFSVRQIKIKFN